MAAKVNPIVAACSKPKPSQTFPKDSACPGPSSNPRGAKNPKVGNNLNPKTPKPITQRPPTMACRLKTMTWQSAIHRGPLTNPFFLIELSDWLALFVNPTEINEMLKKW